MSLMNKSGKDDYCTMKIRKSTTIRLTRYPPFECLKVLMLLVHKSSLGYTTSDPDHSGMRSSVIM